MAETVKILHGDYPEGEPYSYIFADVAELFWPDDYSKSNHAAQDKIIERMVELGCTKLKGYCDYMTPHGRVKFDSESGCFNVNAIDDGPVLYVKTIIDTIKVELDEHRAALA